MQLEKIYVVFKTHVDLGFTDLPSNVYKYYMHEMADDIIEICNKTKKSLGERYVWTMPSWIIKEMITTITGERKKAIDDLIDREQLIWHGLPFTTHTELAGVEEFKRGLDIAKALSEKYKKKEPISAKLTDVPGHTWMLPSMLSDAGIKFLHLGCNYSSKGPNVPELFHWEGPDGKKVLTWYTPDYGTTLLPPKDWPYDIWLALLQSHDNQGPQSESTVYDLIKKLRTKHPETEIIIGSMDDFAADFLQRDYKNIPTINKDLGDTWIHGVASYPTEVAKLREFRYKLRAIESINSEQLYNGINIEQSKYNQHLIDQAYENLLLFDEHTFGMDVKETLNIGRKGKRPFYQEDLMEDRRLFPKSYEKIERSWDEKKAYLHRVVTILDEINFDSKVNKYFQTAKYAFILDERDIIIESNKLRVVFNSSNGKIKSFIDKIHRKEWAKDNQSLLEFEYNVYGKDELNKYLVDYAYDLTDWYISDFGKIGYPFIEHQMAEYELASTEIDDKKNILKLTYKMISNSPDLYGAPKRYTISYSITDDGNGLDVDFEFSDKTGSTLIDSCDIKLSFSSSYTSMYAQKMGAIINVNENTIIGGNRTYHSIDRYSMVCEGELGIVIQHLDSPLVSFGRNGLLKYDETYEPKKSNVFIHLANNQWGTNFPQWIEGSFRSRFRLELFSENDINTVEKSSEKYCREIYGVEAQPIVTLNHDSMRLISQRVVAQDKIQITYQNTSWNSVKCSPSNEIDKVIHVKPGEIIKLLI